MLPSDMNLNITSGTTGYNNKILLSDSRFNLGRNDMVYASMPEKSSHRTSIVQKHAPMPKAACKEVSSKHTSACKAELMHDEEKCFNTHSGQCCRSMVRFSTIRDTRRGDLLANVGLLPRVRNTTRAILSDAEVGRL